MYEAICFLWFGGGKEESESVLEGVLAAMLYRKNLIQRERLKFAPLSVRSVGVLGERVSMDGLHLIITC